MLFAVCWMLDAVYLVLFGCPVVHMSACLMSSYLSVCLHGASVCLYVCLFVSFLSVYIGLSGMSVLWVFVVWECFV